MRQELRFVGVGGQGIITLSYIIGRAAALFDKKRVIMTEAYGPEVTGGFSKADLIICDEEIDFPMVTHPEIMVIMDQGEWDKYKDLVGNGTQTLVDKDLVKVEAPLADKVYHVPAFEAANELGKKVVTNVIMMGALQELTGAVTKKALEKALLDRVPKGTEELNMKALKKGYELGKSLKVKN